MKKLLTLAALLGAVSLSFGQGQLTFNNSAATLIGTNSAPAGHQGVWTGAQTGVTTARPTGQYTFALFVAPSTVNSVAGLSDPNWTLVSYATNTTAASGGRLIGGQPAVAGYNVGATGNFLVRGWDNGIGDTWAAVLNWYGAAGDVSKTGWLGTSSIAQVVLGGGASPIPGLFGATPGTTIGGFTLQQINPIPEPTSFALAGLGAAALLIFRRRK